MRRVSRRKGAAAVVLGRLDRLSPRATASEYPRLTGSILMNIGAMSSSPQRSPQQSQPKADVVSSLVRAALGAKVLSLFPFSTRA